MTAITEYNLTNECQEIARDIVHEMKVCNEDEDWARDRVNEWVDGHQWVIYYRNAHQLCQNCNTDNGEMFLEETSTTPKTYDDFAVAIAFGEMYSRVNEELYILLEELEDEEEETTQDA